MISEENHVMIYCTVKIIGTIIINYTKTLHGQFLVLSKILYFM